MPYYTKKGTGEDKGKTCVYKKDTNKKVGCTDGPVKDYLAALHANANESANKGVAMQNLFDNWRKFISEDRGPEEASELTRWEDYDAPKNKWYDVPVEDIELAAQAKGGEVTIASELYDLIDAAYAKIGGHFDFQKPSDLPDDYTDWSAIELDGDPQPDALRVAKKKGHGLKMAAAGHDGSKEAIDAYLLKTAQLLNGTGYYGEMSKGIAHIMIKYHDVPFVNNKEDVEKVLGKSVEWVGEHPSGRYPNHPGWYVRNIGGKHRDMKILLGRPSGV